VFWASQCLGALAALGTLVLSWQFARRRFGTSDAVALVPCLLLASSGPLATWAASGMETTAFGFFLLLGVFTYLGQLEAPSPRGLALSAAALGVATLLRPEGALVFGVLAGLTLTLFRQRARKALRAWLVWILTYAAPLAVFVAWRLSVFGDLVPNTTHVKTGGGLWQHVRGVSYVSSFSVFYLAPLLPLLVVLAWEVGVPRGARVAEYPSRLVRWANDNAALSVTGAVSLVYVAYIVYVGGDYMAMYRFMVPVVPFVYLMMSAATERLREAAAGMPHKASLSSALVILAAAGTAFQSTPLEGIVFKVPPLQFGTYRGVKDERWHVARLTVIGRFFGEYAKGPKQSLATRSIGASGFHAPNLAIQDLGGLTDRHIARKVVRDMGRGWAGHEKSDLDYSFGRLPTYFMLDKRFSPEDIRAKATTAATMADALEASYPSSKRYTGWTRSHAAFIDEHYRLSTALLDDRTNGERGYFAFLELKP